MKKIVFTGGAGRFANVFKSIKHRFKIDYPSKAKLNIGTHCGFLDCVSKYSKVFQIQRVFPLNQNIIEAEYYVNKENYKEQIEYV